MGWRIFFAALVIIGGVAFVKYSGVTKARDAQEEIAKDGYYYEGETYLTPDVYKELQELLAQRDPSIQTRSDLTILPDLQDGKLHVKYSFFSANEYSYLTKSDKLPSWYNQGNAIAGVAYILIFIAILIWAFSIITGGTKQES